MIDLLACHDNRFELHLGPGLFNQQWIHQGLYIKLFHQKPPEPNCAANLQQ